MGKNIEVKMSFFDQVAKSCSKGYGEWIHFLFKHNRAHIKLLFPDFDKGYFEPINSYVMLASWQALWGWCLEFFDSKGIYILIKTCNNPEGKYSYWYGKINYGKNVRNTEHDRTNTRQEAQKASAKKAFSILEQQIKDKS